MSGTLFGFGFPRKTATTTGAEIEAAANARQEADRQAAEQARLRTADTAAATLAADLGMGKQTKVYKDTPEARRKRRERAPEQRRRKAVRQREKSAKDAAKAAARALYTIVPNNN